MDRIEVHDEDLRALCVLAGVSVMVNHNTQSYLLGRLKKGGKTICTAGLEFSATREQWETAITRLIEAST